MVLWQSDLRVSQWAWWLSLLWHSSAAIAIVIVPWPDGCWFVLMLLLLMVLLDWVAGHLCITRRRGVIALREEGIVQWREHLWHIPCQPWAGDLAIFLKLSSQKFGTEHLWLMRDSMTELEWRQLHQLLLNPFNRGENRA